MPSDTVMSESRAIPEEILQSPAWHRATMLAERAASLHSRPRGADRVEINHASAARRLERWRSGPPFDDDARFAQRLAQDSLTEVDLRRLLGEPIEAVRDRRDKSIASSECLLFYRHGVLNTR